MRHPLPPLPDSWPPGYPRHRAVSAAVARQLDAEASSRHGLPGLVLMEHACQGLAALAARMAQGRRRVLVLCGPGNNGGDGYGAARFLASWGLPVRVLRLAPRPPSGDAAFEAACLAPEVAPEDAWGRPGLVAEALRDAEVVLDAIFGTGAARVEGPYPAWIEAVNAADSLRLAADVPSGLDADAGLPRPVAVRADATGTMALPKTGLVLPSPGVAYAGRVVEIDIGLPAALHLRWRGEAVRGS